MGRGSRLGVSVRKERWYLFVGVSFAANFSLITSVGAVRTAARGRRAAPAALRPAHHTIHPKRPPYVKSPGYTKHSITTRLKLEFRYTLYTYTAIPLVTLGAQPALLVPFSVRHLSYRGIQLFVRESVRVATATSRYYSSEKDDVFFKSPRALAGLDRGGDSLYHNDLFK